MTYGNPFDISRRRSKLYVLTHSFHRNGVKGSGFYVIDFKWFEKDSPETTGKIFRAILFQTDYKEELCHFGNNNMEHIMGNYSITSSDINEKWDGDHFIHDIIEWMNDQPEWVEYNFKV